MKLAVGLIGSVIGLGALGYSMFDTEVIVPERPDPHFDYEAASYEEKVVWMESFLNYRKALSKIERKKTVRTFWFNKEYSIDVENRKLIIDNYPEQELEVDYTEFSPVQKDKKRLEFRKMVQELCTVDLKKAGFVGNTSILFRVHTPYKNLPIITASISEEICRKQNPTVKNLNLRGSASF